MDGRYVVRCWMSLLCHRMSIENTRCPFPPQSSTSSSSASAHFLFQFEYTHNIHFKSDCKTLNTIPKQRDNNFLVSAGTQRADRGEDRKKFVVHYPTTVGEQRRERKKTPTTMGTSWKIQFLFLVVYKIECGPSVEPWRWRIIQNMEL